MSSLQRTPPSMNNNNVTHSKHSRFDPVEKPLTLQTILATINDQFEKTFARIDNLCGKIDTVKSELEGKLNSLASDISTIKADCAAKFEVNDKALRALDEQVAEMTHEIGGLANRNELIIHGIPFLEDENLAAHFKSMWQYVGLPDSISPPVDIRRLKARDRNDGLVLLQFALKNNRDDFYSGYLRKRDLKLSHLGIDSSRRVYVNENLTIAARKLKASALQLKKAGKVSEVFTKLGTVFIKQRGDQPPVAIRTEEHLKPFRR